MKASKKEQILNFYNNENISYDLLAHRCSCSVAYVKKVITDFENKIKNS